MSTIDQLKWATLTAAVNEIKSPNQFLKRLLWSNEETLPTETIEVSTLHGDRVAAPFVKRDGQSIMVAGRTKTHQTITAPTIRISRPLKADELLFGRYPGNVIFADASTISDAIDKKVADELSVLADMIADREEWMCAMALQNALSYSSEDAHFDITFARAAAHNITNTTALSWDTATTSHPWRDFHAAKKLVSEALGLGLTDVILGENALQAWMEHAEVKTQINTQSGLNAGEQTIQNQFRDDGAILMGTFAGLRVWSYPRTVSADGSTVKMIRDDYAEFITTSPAAERVMYYGAIPDAEALEGKLFQSKRFSKAWLEKDPSAWIALIHSRPLPVLRKPNCGVSMKVTNN